jgi:hypothetical protein
MDDQNSRTNDQTRGEFPGAREAGNLTSERRTILENLGRLRDLVEPRQLPGSPRKTLADSMESKLGRFRDHGNDRKLISADLFVLRHYAGQGEEIPSFVEAGPRRELHFDPATVRVGLLTSGGSMATFNAIVCARERHLGADIR